ncbi:MULTISPECIES: MFS transporter [Bacillus cereus group]|uniref:MFS transporter n=1 Tax=Bacillus cereus TaxID=1396 RepID=A0A9W7UWB8_BACCE|nr:MFS transporter [Bacillus cereus]KAB2393491.1 MFS transporter [Bacillus cereus]KAB2405666.1 MFS transporter [Bacillus cereus]KAB2428564.1 MFS transporter [Bacillus cereus]
MNRFLIYILALGAFAMGTTEFVVSGILEVISEDLGVSISLAGQLVTVYAFSFAIGALFLVMVTAKFERKKVLFYSMLFFIVGGFIAFFSFNFIILMVSRIVLALSGGVYFVVATNYAAQLAPAEKRGSAIATVITGFTISLVLGVPLGTFISSFMDWRYIFLFISITMLITSALLNKTLPILAGNTALSFNAQLRLLKDKRLIYGLFTTVLGILGYTMVFAYIAPLLSTLVNFSIEQTSMTLFIIGIFAFIGSRFGGFAVDRWGPNRTISISTLIHAACLLLLIITSASTLSMLLVIVIWGTAAWTTTPAQQYYLISLKPQASETVLSFNTAIMNLGMSLGAGLGGVIVGYTSIYHISWIAGVIVLLSFVTASISFSSNSEKKCIRRMF